MLCALRGKDKAKIEARITAKEDVPFYCPSCMEELILRKGMVRVHHFAHQSETVCRFGLGESEAHRVCKIAIYEALQEADGVSECELEKNFGFCIPDVFVRIHNVPVAIEVQISTLTMAEIMRRTEQYHRASIFVLWLSLPSGIVGTERYAPLAWEKWLHATYFGRVYYWLHAATVIPIHFDEHLLWVEESTWHDEYGSEQSGGGYYKRSLRYRTPHLGLAVQIARDFRPTLRSPWMGGSIQVPSCRLYMDTQLPWWLETPQPLASKKEKIMTKPELYADLVRVLSPCWKEDEDLMDTDSDAWQRARTIDDWLVQYREDDRVGIEQYARNCQRLREIYRAVSIKEAI